MFNIPASIIIPALNEEYYLPALLNSLKLIHSPLDIIVVDGNSRDRTADVVKEFQPLFTGDSSLRIIESNRGISLQRNTGALYAKHDILIFCDADVVIPSNTIYQLIISEFKQKKYVVAAPLFTPIEPGIRIKLVHKLMIVVQRMLMIFKKPYFPGGYLLTRKEIFNRVGGFDTKILLAEDVDYSIRAAKNGSYGLINLNIHVSARRIIKYGYWWLFKETPNLFRLLTKGSVRPETMFYPFGEYGKELND